MKTKIINISIVIINILFIITDLMLGIFLFKFNTSFYYCTLFFMMGISIFNLLMIMLKLIVLPNYYFGVYVPAIHVSYLITAAIAYYIIKWAKHYNEYYLLYWIILAVVTLALVITFVVINKKKGNKKPTIANNTSLS